MAAAGDNQGTYQVDRVRLLTVLTSGIYGIYPCPAPSSAIGKMGKERAKRRGRWYLIRIGTVTGRSSVPEPLRPFNDQSIVITLCWC